MAKWTCYFPRPWHGNKCLRTCNGKQLEAYCECGKAVRGAKVDSDCGWVGIVSFYKILGLSTMLTQHSNIGTISRQALRTSKVPWRNFRHVSRVKNKLNPKYVAEIREYVRIVPMWICYRQHSLCSLLYSRWNGRKHRDNWFLGECQPKRMQRMVKPDFLFK